jgi:hypothetical protein
LTNDALQAIKLILDDFGVISGLRCNVDKSQIMIVGTNTVPDYVADSGFAMSDAIKVLGFNITSDTEMLKNNFTPAIAKIRSLKQYWERFRLSLSGRINVAKTLMLSQIGFHSAILDPDPVELSQVQQTINNFVTG